MFVYIFFVFISSFPQPAFLHNIVCVCCCCWFKPKNEPTMRNTFFFSFNDLFLLWVQSVWKAAKQSIFDRLRLIRAFHDAFVCVVYILVWSNFAFVRITIDWGWLLVLHIGDVGHHTRGLFTYSNLNIAGRSTLIDVVLPFVTISALRYMVRTIRSRLFYAWSLEILLENQMPIRFNCHPICVCVFYNKIQSSPSSILAGDIPFQRRFPDDEIIQSVANFWKTIETQLYSTWSILIRLRIYCWMVLTTSKQWKISLIRLIFLFYWLSIGVTLKENARVIKTPLAGDQSF